MRCIKDQRGSVPILFIGFIFILLILTLLLLEMGAAYENFDNAEAILQRSCNSAVEKNIDDTYRADRVLLLDTAAAEADFRSYVASDMPDKYTISIHSITMNETPPAMTVTGTVTFSTLFDQFDIDDVTFRFEVSATNTRLE
jgi:hypothetical protein